MKFINYLTSIADISIYPMLSLIIFFGFFTSLIIYVVKYNKDELKELSDLPLAEEHNKHYSNHE